ncbi:hypothetical protein Taro_008880 [Colocasia esculenta]|uniref:Uncharacterized protein n=1 Tax=Colocasia esculenta TaxID=4460 RepID=A0A843U4A2_COLES|nr:hypothetical protein [Colocasia esculenta]
MAICGVTAQYEICPRWSRIHVSTPLWCLVGGTVVLRLCGGTNFYCKGSVDTPHTGVDTMLQALSQKMKKWSTSVDTSPSQVDTREPSQKACFSVGYSRSTLNYLRSTLDASPRELFCPVWDSVSTHPMGRSTHSGNSVT